MIKYRLNTKKIRARTKKSNSFGAKISSFFAKILKLSFAFALLGLVIMVILPKDLSQLLPDTSFLAEKLDFKVTTIEVDGNDKVDANYIVNLSGIKKGDKTFSVPIEEIKAKLETESWIKTASIYRIIPGTIKILIDEETVGAVFLKNQDRYLVSSSGKILEKVKSDDVTNGYLSIKGVNANLKYRDLLSQLLPFKEITEQLDGLEFISQRRWNLILKSKSIIKLPQTNINEALQAFRRISNQNKTLTLPTYIDLRLAPDKIYFKFPN